MKKKQILACSLAVALLTGCGAAAVSGSMSEAITLEQVSSQLTKLQKSVDSLTSNPETISSSYETLHDEQIETDVSQSPTSIILSLKNKTEAAYSEIRATIVYYGEDNNMLAYDVIYFNNVSPDTPYIQTCYIPSDKSGTPISFNHFEIVYAGIIGVDIADNLGAKVESVSNIGADGNVIARLTNRSGQELSSVTASVLYYKNEDIIGSSSASCFDIPIGEYGIVSFEPPCDQALNPLEFDSYELIITEALPRNASQ